MSTKPIQPALIASDHPVTPVVQADRVVDGFISLLDEVDNKSIAAEYGIGIHSKRIDFLEHGKIGFRLGIADPDSLENLSQQDTTRERHRYAYPGVEQSGDVIDRSMLEYLRDAPTVHAPICIGCLPNSNQ